MPTVLPNIDHRAGRVPLSVWAKRWLDGDQPPTPEPKTFASYDSLLRSRITPAFGRHPVGALKPSEIQAWVGAKVADGVSSSRIRQAVVMLRQILDAASATGVIRPNPAARIKLPRLEQREAPTSILDDLAARLDSPAAPARPGTVHFLSADAQA